MSPVRENLLSQLQGSLKGPIAVLAGGSSAERDISLSSGRAVLAPFEYASILFAILFGYAFFDEVPTASVLIGAAIVVLAGVLIIWRERQLGLKRGQARANMTPQG